MHLARPTHDLTNAERRVAERSLWGYGLVAAVIVHLLVFFLWWGRPIPQSPFAAAGPRAGSDRAAAGGLQTMNIRLPQPRVITRPELPLLTFDPVPELEVDEEQTLVETSSILGDRPGPPGPGLDQGDGAGDGGTADQGLFRAIPPSPRGIIFPPAIRSVRGQEVEVWVFVNELGRVVADSTQLRPPTSDRGYNERLIQDAAGWQFEPARRGGQPVSSWFPYRISM